MFLLDVARAGDLLLDVGANIGFYTAVLARRGVHVIAFEPFPPAQEALRHNMILNNVETMVTLAPFAVGDRDDVAAFTRELESSNHLVTGDVAPGATLMVEVRRLDGYLATELHQAIAGGLLLLKVDAEGFDLAVLNGGEHTISERMPVIMIEVWNGGIDIRQWLGTRGYIVYRYDPETRTLHRLRDDFDDEGNLLAVHRDRENEVLDRVRSARRGVWPAPHVEWWGR